MINAAAISSISKCFSDHVSQTLPTLCTMLCFGVGVCCFFLTYWLLQWSLALATKREEKITLKLYKIHIQCDIMLESRVLKSSA